MNFYLGVTDNSWYNFLARQNREDINFWQPGGHTAFKVLIPGEPFLFTLRSPVNAIGGIGFFQAIVFYRCRWHGMYLKMAMAVARYRTCAE
jgi:putative restriction endonuclease